MRVALVTITEPVLLKLYFGAVIDSLSTRTSTNKLKRTYQTKYKVKLVLMYLRLKRLMHISSVMQDSS